MKKTLLPLAVLAFPFLTSARVLTIPKGEIALKEISTQKTYVLKSSKGTILQKSILAQLTPENWFNLAPSQGAEGVGSELVYEKYGIAASEDIIVAVIDSGVDVNHEDLQGKIWINAKEIPNNGLDDDQNGYVDDVFGWNFIGGADGMAAIEADAGLENGLRLVKGKVEAQVDADTLEVTRELVRMKKLKLSVERLGESLTAEQAEYLNKLTKVVGDAVTSAKKIVAEYSLKKESYLKNEKILKEAGLSEVSIPALRSFTSEDAAVKIAKNELLALLSAGNNLSRLEAILGYYGDQAKYYYNEEFNPRERVKDDYSNQTERFYGNNDVIGPDSSHGTHVSGIIAAERDNSLGIKGVATNVKIMAIRVVPNGDERDKDVANGIRYAVDNGAKIINMSFGKAYSPFKKVVDEAVRYAESKGVLMVHAAGNDNKNNDILTSYPSRFDKLNANREFRNWMEIGASSFKKGLSLPADFSNYGKKTVDIFAPGVDILSATPDNSYDTYSGTSMAAPAASGVAALALSYAPSMDAEAMKALMLDTSRRYPNLKVNRPGEEVQVLFSELSSNGGITDALKAVNSLFNP